MSAGVPSDSVVERVRRRLATGGAPPTRAALAGLLREETGGLAGDAGLLDLLRVAEDELSGAGPLAPLLRDPATTDVLVNGPDEVWVEQDGDLRRSEIRFADDGSVRRLAQRLAAAAGRRLDDASPWVDATLPDGSRLHAILPPVAVGGTCLSLRTLRHRAFSIPELVGAGTLTSECADLIAAIVDARLAFLVTGGTGSGKTTLLGSILSLVDPRERVILVEDADELRPNHPHAVRLISRPSNVEDAGEVTLRDLVRQALRMRPDRIVVGEVRGAEVVELLAALNTGHDGGAGTLHANGVADVPARLEALAVLGGLSRDALHSQLAAAIDVVIHLRRGRDGVRRVQEIGLLQRSGERCEVVPSWRLGSDDRADLEPAAGALAEVIDFRRERR